MTILRVLLSETWPDEPAADWALLADDGRLMNAGHGEPREWPRSDRTEALLLGAQAGWHTVRVPRASQREQLKSIPFVLEELLLREPDSQHITPTERGEEHWAVLVAARERVRRIAAQFAAIARPLDALWCSAQSVPWQAGEWSVAVHDAQAWLRTGAHAAIIDDITDSAPPMLIGTAAAQAHQAGSVPSRVRLYGDSDTVSWARLLGVPIEAAGAWQWHQIGADATDLLHGEFEARHRRKAWMQQLRPAAILAGVVIGAHLLLSIGDVLLRRHEIGRLRSDMQLLITRQLPNTPVLDPPVQLHQALNVERAKRGLLTDGDALSLLADTAAALGNEARDVLQSVRSERNAIAVVIQPGRLDPATLRNRLAPHGLVATPMEGSTSAFRIRRAG